MGPPPGLVLRLLLRLSALCSQPFEPSLGYTLFHFGLIRRFLPTDHPPLLVHLTPRFSLARNCFLPKLNTLPALTIHNPPLPHRRGRTPLDSHTCRDYARATPSP